MYFIIPLLILLILEGGIIVNSCNAAKKLSSKNKLLCRENHKLRLKLKTYEDSTKG